MPRRGFLVLVVLVLVLPLVPATGASMPCCRGGGDACACPIESGFSRCEEEAPPSLPLTPPALLPPAPPAFAITACLEEPAACPEAMASLARPPLIPPPRA